MVYEQYRYAKREYKNIDAWLITMWDNKCLMAIHEYDYIHQIIVGSLKLRVRLFGGDRNKVSSYKEWRQYSDAGLRDPETKISAGMLDIANAIIAALEPPT
jgi:hypothetical protein